MLKKYFLINQLVDLSLFNYTDRYNVVVCLPRPMEGMGRLQFSDLFTERPFPPEAVGIVGTC